MARSANPRPTPRSLHRCASAQRRTARRANRLAARLALAAGLVGLAAATTAQSARLRASVEPAEATVGDPIVFTLTAELEGNTFSAVSPTAPDWGGLQVRQGPSNEFQMLLGDVRAIQTWQWELVAPREGEYTIGPATLVLDGQTYRSEPVIVRVRPPAPSPLDAALQGVRASARTSDAQLNAQLRDRLFLQATVSNPTPRVGEPVIVAYTLYQDRELPTLRNVQESVADVPSAITEVLFETNRLIMEETAVAGRPFRASLRYRLAVVPNRPGPLPVQAYRMSGMLAVDRRSRRMRGDSFGPQFPWISFLDDGIDFEIAAPPIELDVRPLPEAGKPAGFTGTVGDYTLQARVDRDRMSEDDLLTLELTLEGRGMIALADAPAWPESTDFERIDQNVETVKTNRADMVAGRKKFIWILRPRRPGALTVPSIEYAIFDPFADRYRVLRTPPFHVEVAPGIAGGARPASDQTATPTASTPIEQLRYLKPIERVHPRPGLPLLRRPAFWATQLAAAGLLAVAWIRDRRRETADRARQRRRDAWRRFERSLREIRRDAQTAAADSAELAGRLDRAVRTLIAERFDRSPDGLTRDQIERLLMERAVPSERVARLIRVLDGCAALRYAPPGSRSGEIETWIDACLDVLHDGGEA